MADRGGQQLGERARARGTMYCGDHDHYDFMTDAFGLFAHVNVLQRDICPSATRFEGEIIAMTLDLLHGGRGHRRASRGGLVTSGGTGSILPRGARLPRPRPPEPRDRPTRTS